MASGHKGPVILVNQATPRIGKLWAYSGTTCASDAPRRISCNGDRTPAQGVPGHPPFMTPRNTSTGAVLEAMILPGPRTRRVCRREQQTIGTRCGGGTHKVDAIATRGDDRILVSLKWQQTGGTAEQKVPFEVMCLADAVTAGHAVRAFLVLGGDGWKLRDYFTSGQLSEHLIDAALVRVVTLEAFIRLANNGQL